MISEKQILHILTECEAAIGKPLEKLRNRLLCHDMSFSHIWELITLYSILPLGQVEAESQPGEPDVCLRCPSCPPIWIEASYIYPRHKEKIRDSRDFPSWIRRSLLMAGVHYAKYVNIEISASDPSEDFTVPPRNQWKKMTSHPSWNSFIKSARSSDLKKAKWTCPLGNVSISLDGVGHYPMTTLPSIGLPETVRDHPVYKNIMEKARQATKWKKLGSNYDPLVLCFGASEEILQIESSYWSAVPLRKAVYAALLDRSKLSDIQAYNITGSMSNKRMRVKGSKYISGVIVVTLENKYEPLTLKKFRNYAKAQLFLNDHAEVTLSQEQKELIQSIDFNKIEYGPGWEAWDTSNLLRPSTNTVLDRQRRRWGGASISSWSDGTIEIKIPVVLLARILSGDISAVDAWGEYGGDVLRALAIALGKGQEIIDCKFISSDPKSREENQVSLRFGPPKSLVIRDKSVGKRKKD